MLLFLLRYYDVDGKLFKSEHFEKISMVDNVPTVMKIVMNDMQIRR
jgi:hypothetical protein